MAQGFFNGLTQYSALTTGRGLYTNTRAQGLGDSLFSSGLPAGGLDKAWDTSGWRFGATTDKGFGLRANYLHTPEAQSSWLGSINQQTLTTGLNLAAGVISALGSGVSSALAAKGTNALLSAQAHIAENNAIMAENQAVQAKSAAEWTARKVSADYGRLKAQQKTAQAANGVAIGVGSAAETTATTDIHKFIDMRQAMINGLMESWSYKARAASYRNRAAAARGSMAGPMGVGLSTAGSSLAKSYFGYAAKVHASLGDETK